MPQSPSFVDTECIFGFVFLRNPFPSSLSILFLGLPGPIFFLSPSLDLLYLIEWLLLLLLLIELLLIELYSVSLSSSMLSANEALLLWVASTAAARGGRVDSREDEVEVVEGGVERSRRARGVCLSVRLKRRKAQWAMSGCSSRSRKEIERERGSWGGSPETAGVSGTIDIVFFLTVFFCGFFF